MAIGVNTIKMVQGAAIGADDTLHIPLLTCNAVETRMNHHDCAIPCVVGIS